jgi:O-acetylhomoserine (thiol)-lyase
MCAHSHTRRRAMTKPRTHQFDTLSLHAGAAPDPVTGARATPIYQTASFVLPDSDHAAALFNMERAGHVYSRISNPTCAVLEERVAALEGGVGAIATASGQAALHLAIATLQGAGTHIVASRSLYGGAWCTTCSPIRCAWHRDHVRRSARHRRLARAIRPGTRMLFGETLGNPGLDVLDIPRVAALAHDHGLPLCVDSSTFTTPWLPASRSSTARTSCCIRRRSSCRPRRGDRRRAGRWRSLCVEFRTRRWKFPTLTAPYAGFHDMVFAEESTTAAFLLARGARFALISARAWRRSPRSRSCRGIETLPLRMAKHVDNTRKVVAFLRAHPLVGAIEAIPSCLEHPGSRAA